MLHRTRPLVSTTPLLAVFSATLALLVASGLLAAPQAHAHTAPEASQVLKFGDTGWRVRVLQSRLHQLKLHSEVITSRFDAETRTGVQAFQRRRHREVTGRVDALTWQKLLEVTDKPTKEALHNVYTPGKTLIGPGAKGIDVRRLQARLAQKGLWKGEITGVYDETTSAAVSRFQKSVKIPVTGEVDRRTLERLRAGTHEPSKAELYNLPTGPASDPRCRTGRVLCIDKTSRTLRWLINGEVLKTVDVRFGSDEMPTREGAFTVFKMSRDHVSSIYHTSMPFAMFFSGGQAVHYSPDFAATGYNGASHGCVNVRDYAAIKWLFDTQVHIGDKVIIYRS